MPEDEEQSVSRVEARLQEEVPNVFELNEKTSTESGTHYVDFEENDPENPFNFSVTNKWIITATANAFTGLTAATASTFALGVPSMERDLYPTTIKTALSVSVYALGFGIIPLVTASFSEEFGRRPLYIASAAIVFLMHIAIALSHDIESIIVFRFIQGAAGSSGATMVGGSVADIWATHERGLPMSTFALAASSAIGFGPAIAGWIEMNPRLEWRWIQWIHAIASGVYVLFVLMFMRETRGGVILTRRARKIRKKTKDVRYRARIEDERDSLKTLIWISCTRPIHLLLTEPIVFSFSLWISFAWGILYGQTLSIGLVFRALYHFNQGQIGLVFLSISIGSIFGFISNFYQEKLYARYSAKRGPEARLYSACIAGVLFPLGCFIYAWTSFPHVSWIGPFIGLTIFMFAVFMIYLAVFSYLADCYFIYASSALAGQSLGRNIAGAVFPLFINQMYTNLTFKWASTLLGCIATVMAPIPIILFFWGPKIRARSGFAQKLERWSNAKNGR